MSNDALDRLDAYEDDGRITSGGVDVAVFRGKSRSRVDVTDTDAEHGVRAGERPDWRARGYDAEYDRNRARVLREENVCHLCGEHVDVTLSGRDRRGGDPWGRPPSTVRRKTVGIAPDSLRAHRLTFCRSGMLALSPHVLQGAA